MMSLLAINIQLTAVPHSIINTSSIDNDILDIFPKHEKKNSILPKSDILPHNISSEVHIYVKQTDSSHKYTDHSIFLCPKEAHFIINLHIASLKIINAGRIIQIDTGILHLYFSGENDLHNSDSLTTFFSDMTFAGIECSGNAQLILEAEESSNDHIIHAIGSYFSPGIGASIGNYSGDNCQLIHIKSGHINASSGFHGAAIGAGYGQINNSSNVAQILIEGGIIEARSQPQGNGGGIGTGGPITEFSSNVGSIIINGGEIKADGGVRNPGIGASVNAARNAPPNSGTIQTIIFKSGYIVSNLSSLNFGAASAIGTGRGAHQDSQGGNVATINFTGSSIYARHFSGTYGYYAAVVGAGYGEGPNSSLIQEINIISGEIEIINQNSNNGNYNGVGLGGGRGNNVQSSNVDNIRIGTKKDKFLGLNISSTSTVSPALGSYTYASTDSGQLKNLEIGKYINYLYIKSGKTPIDQSAKTKATIDINLTYSNSNKDVSYSHPYDPSTSNFSPGKMSLSTLLEIYMYAFQVISVI